jgi:Zinc knuckle
LLEAKEEVAEEWLRNDLRKPLSTWDEPQPTQQRNMHELKALHEWDDLLIEINKVREAKDEEATKQLLQEFVRILQTRADLIYEAEETNWTTVMAARGLETNVPEGTTCYTCDEPGHYATNCLTKQVKGNKFFKAVRGGKGAGAGKRKAKEKIKAETLAEMKEIMATVTDVLSQLNSKVSSLEKRWGGGWRGGRGG